ncbi:arginine transporter [Tropicibacter oceani]|uniref:Arginine transporter n=1 Tax=Tropicibacter oceani TaxID=3058420 RepID=A0ABY8QNH5_9RHOB|nr:arginine transporter [Tropicibacter oceani]WGW05588.1 arginine transporter [Tropicibacter oceani]
MKTAGLMLVAVLAVAACGGGDRNKRNYGGGTVTRAASVNFATGPVSRACLTSGRKAANSRLCGCIQGVANRDLSSNDQRKAAKFFSDPHQAQETRQSDNPSNEAFWKRYKAFAARAEASCTGL